ncbi:MAG: MoaD/ThiS family protein [Rhodospirillales bacterium]|nr:MoaD/ThiS family protein [Rhodospirillales bacterium]
MHIRVKLYALLDKHLPAGTASGPTGNEADLDFADGNTVGGVIKHLKVPSEHCHLVLVNGVFVPPGERDAWALAEGDHLAVWPPVAGG